MFEGVFKRKFVGKGPGKKLVDLRVVDIRDFAQTNIAKRTIVPMAAGRGWFSSQNPLWEALKSVGAGVPLRGPKARKLANRPTVIYLSPQGRPLTQQLADDLAKKKRLVLVAGHYEGIDERIFDWVDMEISVGDVVLTGGEIPAMAVVDAVVRKVPGVVKEAESLEWDSLRGGGEGGWIAPISPVRRSG
jgi:tRNA (guanine37-N1)-methyltransferase